MAVGTSSYLNNLWLNAIRGSGATGITAMTTIYAQLHTSAGTPGSAGTSNVSSINLRKAINFTVSAGVMTNSAGAVWLDWSGTNGEVLRYVSFWDALTAGNFLWYADMLANYTISTNDTFTVSVATLSIANAS